MLHTFQVARVIIRVSAAIFLPLRMIWRNREVSFFDAVLFSELFVLWVTGGNVYWFVWICSLLSPILMLLAWYWNSDCPALDPQFPKKGTI